MYASLTITTHFSAAHRLARPDLDDETNRSVYGKCARPNGHGHDYLLHVTVTGRVDDRTGLTIESNVLRDLLNTEIIEPLDHHFLNKDVEHFATTVPTAENIALYIRDVLQAKLPSLGVQLQRIKLHESPNNSCEVFATVANESEPVDSRDQALAIA